MLVTVAVAVTLGSASRTGTRNVRSRCVCGSAVYTTGGIETWMFSVFAPWLWLSTEADVFAVVLAGSFGVEAKGEEATKGTVGLFGVSTEALAMLTA